MRQCVSGAQGAVELEIVALVFLDEAARQHDLEDVPAQAVGDSLADIGLVLLVREGGNGLPYGMEAVRIDIGAVHLLLNLRQAALFILSHQFHQHHRVVEMVEHDDVLVQDVEDVGGIVPGLGLVLDRDVLEIAHRVEGHVSVEAAHAAIFALDIEAVNELIDSHIRGVIGGQGLAEPGSVGISEGRDAVFDGDTADGRDADEGTGVLASVVVAGLHQGRLGIEVAQFHIDGNGRMEVGQALPGDRGVLKSCHIPSPFPCSSDRSRHPCRPGR